MARIKGIEIPNEKRIETSLTYIYGIGPATSAKILKILILIQVREQKILQMKNYLQLEMNLITM